MRKINKITNMALIFTLIGVFLCRDLYALRVPMTGHKKVIEALPSVEETENRVDIVEIDNHDIELIGKALAIDEDFESLAYIPDVQNGKYRLIAAVDQETSEVMAYGLYFFLKNKPNGINFFRSYTLTAHRKKGVFTSFLDYLQEQSNYIVLRNFTLDPNLQGRLAIDEKIRAMLYRRGFKPYGKSDFIWERSDQNEIAEEIEFAQGDIDIKEPHAIETNWYIRVPLFDKDEEVGIMPIFKGRFSRQIQKQL